MKTSLGRIAVATVALASIGATSVVLATEFRGQQDETPSSHHSTPSRFQDEPSAYQQAILADSHVTDEELSAAVDATLVCLKAKGLNASIAAGKPGPGVNRSFHIVTEDDVSPKPALTDCKKQFMDQVEWRYATERDTRTPVSRSTIDQVFDECLEAKGFAGAPEGSDPAKFWTSERLNEAGSQAGGDEAIRACFNAIGHLRPG